MKDVSSCGGLIGIEFEVVMVEEKAVDWNRIWCSVSKGFQADLDRKLVHY